MSPKVWIIIIIVAVIVFAAPKLPQIARSLGQSLRIFKKEVKELKKDDEETPQLETGNGDKPQQVDTQVTEDAPDTKKASS